MGPQFSLVFWRLLLSISGGKFLPEKHPHNSFAAFTNPFADEFDTGHQMVNGYYAMFNRGLFGRGLGNSIQKRGFLMKPIPIIFFQS